MTYFEAYLFTRLDSLDSFFMVIGGLTFIGSLGILFGFAETDNINQYKQFVKRIWKITVPICFMSLLLTALIPSTKEAAFIYIAPKILNNVDLQDSIKEMPKLTNLGLEYLNDILEKKVKELKE